MEIPHRGRKLTFSIWINHLVDNVPIRRLDDEDLKELLRAVWLDGYYEGRGVVSGAVIKAIRDLNK